MLLIAAVVALAWANSPWGDGYERFWTTPAEVRLGSWTIGDDVRHWVNDGLMTLFFLVVGLEIKREFQTGELRDRRFAALPVVAAIGGMIVPALIYLALNVGGPGTSGWGIPMATDIAFALGVLVLAARHAPAGLKPFILTLAIVDDIGAIIVIALFYAGGVSIGFLAAAAALCGVMFLLRRAGSEQRPPSSRSARSCGSRRTSPGSIRRSRASCSGCSLPPTPTNGHGR